MEEPKNCYDNLKHRVYTLYLRICKNHFYGNESVEEDSFDELLAVVCVCNIEDKITHEEFKELSGYLVRTYELYKLGME